MGEEEPDSGAVRLARFNADQLRQIERAIAEHLDVDTVHVDGDGFSVTPDAGSDGRFIVVHWRGSARLETTVFQAILAAATADDDSAAQRWQGRHPEPHGPVPRPRRFQPRRRRDAGPTED
jgi:hypothetical protein